MRFVPTKTPEQQSCLTLHRTQHLFIRQQTAIINSIRAHLAEFGIVTPIGRRGVEQLLKVVADASDTRVSAQHLRPRWWRALGIPRHFDRDWRRLVEADLRQKDQQLADVSQVLQQREQKLAEAQTAQADLMRKERELDDARREIELTVEKRVRASLLTVRETAKREAEESLTLKVREKEEQITSMQRQIEELRRKAEQGSRQLQGEVQELELERLLCEQFPFDQIEAVPKGEFGGDVIQYVTNSHGQRCGAILWETKRTKNWSDGWLVKLREDQRAAKADVALIVSQALPKGLNAFDLVDGVWVSEPRCAMAVALALRESLIAIGKARIAGEGQQTKMEMVYQYLTGPRFRHRVEAVVEKFAEMQSDLDRERKTMTRLWAKREEQIRGVTESTAGMYGDLQGIAGRTLQEIAGSKFH